jgi:hypothetical protein
MGCAVACHTITVTNYRFMWCSVVINVNLFWRSIVCYGGKFYFEDFLNSHFELFEENCMKIVSIGKIYLMDYELSRFLK